MSDSAPLMMNGQSPSLLENGVYLLYDQIHQMSSRDVISWILSSNFHKARKYEHLTLMINSHGGELSSMMAIIDAMNGSAIPVWTVGMGVIASAALCIFMSGNKGNRILTPNTMILSHQYSAGRYGKEHELVAGVHRDEIVTDQLLKLYKKNTGLSEKIIRSKLLPPNDVWMTAPEAKKYNICDTIQDIK